MDLKPLLRAFGVRDAIRRAEIEDALLDLMAGPGLAQAVAQLSKPDRTMLAMLAHGDGRLRPSRLQPIGLGMPAHRVRRESWYDDRDLQAVDLWLDDHGLIPGMAERLRALLPDPWPERPRTLRPAADQDRAADAWDAETALEAVVAERKHLTFTRRGALDAASLKRLRGTARGEDRAYADLRWSALAALVERGEGSDDPQALLKHWSRGTAPLDYAGLDLLAAGPYTPELDTASWRRVLLAGLRQLPVGAWTEMSALVTWMRQQPLAALIPADHHHELCLGARGGESSLDSLGASGLDWLDSAWIAQAVGGALAGLGVVEVALGGGPTRPKDLANVEVYPTRYGEGVPLPDVLSPAEAVTAFRLTATGAWLLGSGPKPAVRAAGSWRLQADGTMICLGERASGPLRAFAARVGAVINERSWRLDRGLIMKALADDMSANALRAKLRELAGGEPPATVTALIDDAIRRHAAVAIGPLLRVLTVSDPLAYDQLRHDRTTRDLVTDLGQNRLGVDPERLTALRTAARKLGWRIP
ncbi:MAG: hypothetical protein RLZZ127_1186 [Planctomycetota bacterium]|jgi:hypothetical protein